MRNLIFCKISSILSMVIVLLSILFLNTPFVLAQSCENVEQDLTTHINSQFSQRLSSSIPGKGLDIYNYRGNSTYDSLPTANDPWVRNPDSWTQKGTPLDFTGVAGWNDDSAHVHWSPYTGGATMITRRHFMTANHFKIYPGSTVVFFDKEGKPVIRKVVDEVLADTYAKFYFPDINIGLLDRDVDSTIASYPIMKTDLLISMLRGTYNRPLRIPIVVFNQKAQAMVRQTNNITLGLDTNSYFNTNWEKWTGQVVGGDSGQPAFLIINNQPVLLFTNMSGDGSAANNGSFIDEINQAINLLNTRNNVGRNDRVTEYNSRCFTVYPPLNPSISLSKNSFRTGERVVIKANNFVDTARPSIILKNESTNSSITIQWGRSVTDFIGGTGFEKELKDGEVTFEIPGIAPGRYELQLLDLSNNKASVSISVTSAGLAGQDTGNRTNSGQAGNSPAPTTSPGSGSNSTNANSPIGTVTTTNETSTNTTSTRPTSTPTPRPDNRRLPSVLTASSVRIYSNSVDLVGKIESNGDDILLSRGFLYGGSSYSNIVSEYGSLDTGDYMVRVNNLACGSTYIFKAFARNSVGTSYGREYSFSMPSCQNTTVPSPSPTPRNNVFNNNRTNSTITNNVVEQKIITVTDSPSSNEFKRNLKLGDAGNDVKEIQIFLNNLGYTIAEFGPGSAGSETGVFDENTRQALIRYQTDLSDSGIQPTGILDNATQIFVDADLARLNGDYVSTQKEGRGIEIKNDQNNNLFDKALKFILENIVDRIWRGMKNTFSL